MDRLGFSRWGFLSALATAVFCFELPKASAQSLFGGSTAGQTGGSAFGGGTGGAGRTGGGLGQTGGLGGATGAGGGQGNSLNTSGLNSQTGMSGPQLNTELGALSETIGQGGFVGRSDTAGTFVGNQMAGQQSIQGTNVSGQGGQFGGRGQFGGNQFSGRGAGGNQGNFNNRGGRSSRRVVRHSLRIAFDHPQAENTAIQSKLSTQFQNFGNSRPELEGVEVQIGGDQEVILRGQVGSENDKKLAAMLARLEPGVRSVRNELAIEGN